VFSLIKAIFALANSYLTIHFISLQHCSQTEAFTASLLAFLKYPQLRDVIDNLWSEDF
jgi:hypothetical protein